MAVGGVGGGVTAPDTGDIEKIAAEAYRTIPELLRARTADFLASHALFHTEPFAVTQFHLYSSHLRPEGALHRIEASYPLIGGED